MKQIALRRDMGTGRREVWRVCLDEDLILETPGTHLIFLDAPLDKTGLDLDDIVVEPTDDEDDELEEDERRTDKQKLLEAKYKALVQNRDACSYIRQAAEHEVRRRNPTSHELLTRVQVESQSGWHHGVYHYHRALTQVVALPAEREYFDRPSETNLAEEIPLIAALAQAKCQAGELGIRIPDEQREYWSLRGGYSRFGELLLDNDCRLKEIHEERHGQICEEPSYFIVWDPKHAQTVRKRRERQKERSGSGEYRSVSFITCDEFYRPIDAMREMIDKIVPLEYKDLRNYYARTCRWRTVHDFVRALDYICRCYGREAYRWLPAWHDWLQLWKTHGEATWKNFGGRDTWHSNPWQKLFRFFDEEVKRGKPRGRPPNWDKIAAQRTIGLPDKLTEADYAAKYDRKLLERKYPELYKALLADEARAAEHAENERRKKEAAEARRSAAKANAPVEQVA